MPPTVGERLTEGNMIGLWELDKRGEEQETWSKQLKSQSRAIFEKRRESSGKLNGKCKPWLIFLGKAKMPSWPDPEFIYRINYGPATHKDITNALSPTITTRSRKELDCSTDL